MICGIIDVGSNTIRLSIYRCENGTFKLLLGKKVMAGLAGYVQEGVLTRRGIRKAVAVLQSYRELLDNFDIRTVRVFATASLRNVANSAETLEEIERETSFSVDLISGTEEAALDFVGAAHTLDITDGVMVDIGGGSTELVSYEKGIITSGCSLPMGSLSLFTKYVSGLFPTREERHAIRDQVEAELERARTAKVRCRHLTGVGGTIRAAAKLCNDLAGTDPDNRIIPAGELQTLYKGLKKGDRDTLRQILRSAPDRVHTILPGLIILNAVMKSYGVETVSVSACGVREGYLMNRVMGVTQHD